MLSYVSIERVASAEVVSPIALQKLTRCQSQFSVARFDREDLRRVSVRWEQPA